MNKNLLSDFFQKYYLNKSVCDSNFVCTNDQGSYDHHCQRGGTDNGKSGTGKYLSSGKYV